MLIPSRAVIFWVDLHKNPYDHKHGSSKMCLRTWFCGSKNIADSVPAAGDRFVESVQSRVLNARLNAWQQLRKLKKKKNINTTIYNLTVNHYQFSRNFRFFDSQFFLLIFQGNHKRVNIFVEYFCAFQYSGTLKKHSFKKECTFRNCGNGNPSIPFSSRVVCRRTNCSTE